MKQAGNWLRQNPFLCLVILTALICLYKIADFRIYQSPTKALGWDGACYYAYLPAAIVHHDVSFGFTEQITNPQTQQAIAYVTTPDGKRLPKTTCGVALMYLPFYLLAHGIHQFTHTSPIDGYEPIYLFFICLGAVVYIILSLVLLRKLLRHFFSDWVTALTLTAVFWGTNLYFYVVREPFMSHVYTFFLLSLLVYLSYSWRNSFKLYNGLVLGCILALITLIRPTNLVFAAIPFLVNVTSLQTAKNRGIQFSKNYGTILAGLLVFVLVISIQPLLWKLGTGAWFRLSYGNERFFWLKPHIVDGLVSYRKGWLIYSPVMIFGILGFFFLRKRLKEVSLAVVTVLLLNLYIVFSWWCWWYGGSYGMRALIDSYPLWILCFAAFVDRVVATQNKVAVSLLVVILVYGVSSNIHQTRQYRIGHIHHDSMTRRAFWAGYWKEAPPPGFEQLLSPPDYEAAKQGREEDTNR